MHLVLFIPPPEEASPLVLSGLGIDPLSAVSPAKQPFVLNDTGLTIHAQRGVPMAEEP